MFALAMIRLLRPEGLTFSRLSIDVRQPFAAGRSK